MDSDHPSALWQDMPSFYVEIIEKFGAKLQPMVDLTERIAASRWATQLYPCTSMEALGLSRHARYDESMADRTVWFEYVENVETFRVTFQEGRGGAPSTTHEAPSIDDEMWGRIEAWLGIG